MHVHRVRQGECLSSIALSYGFRDPKTIHDHPDNAELKKLRPDPNLLFPGDSVVIPDLEQKEVSAATTRHHRYQVKVPAKVLRLRLVGHGDEPRANEPYVLRIGDVVHEGKTNGDGEIEETEVALTDRSAELEIGGEVHQLALSALNPLKDAPDEGVSGAQARLANLGFDVGPIDGEPGPRTRMAIALFQSEEGLEVTGDLDDATRSKLAERHRC